MNEYVINPNNYRKDGIYLGCLSIFWFIWAPLTLIVLLLAVTEKHPFLFIWLIFGFIGTILIPIVILQRNRIQKVVVFNGVISIVGTGILPGSKTFHPDDIKRFTLEHYEGESILTLNIFTNARPHRIMLTNFVSPKDKQRIFNELYEFLIKNGFEFQFNRYSS